MPNSIFHVRAWFKASKWDFAVLTLTLVLILALVGNVVRLQIQDDSLYHHPFAVSNTAKDMEVSVLRVNQHLLEGDSLKPEFDTLIVQPHIDKLYRHLKTLNALYLGDEGDLRAANASVHQWVSLGEQLVNTDSTDPAKFHQILLLYRASLNTLMADLGVVHKYAINKADHFHRSSQYALVGSLMSIGIIALMAFVYLLRRSKIALERISRYAERIENSRNLYKHILNSFPDSVIISLKDGTILDGNVQASQLLGYSTGEFKNILVNDLIPADLHKQYGDYRDRFFNAIAEKSVQLASMKRRSLRAVKKSGDEVDVAISMNVTAVGDRELILLSLHDISEQIANQKKIFHQANFDSLTNLPNRLLAEDRFYAMCKVARRNNRKLALLYIDLDDFKKVNDSLGHEVGDQLLTEVSTRMQACIRESDTLARLGGDEFAIFLGDIHFVVEAEQKAKEVIQAISRDITLDRYEVQVGACIGITIFPDNGASYSELMRSADAAMYHAKSLGRNRCCLFVDSIAVNISQRFKIETEMMSALEKNEFSVEYQPLLRVSDGKLLGVEALLRWNSKSLGCLRPDEFITIAENNGLIVEIGNFVINSAIKYVGDLEKSVNLDEFRLSINLSLKQLVDPNLYNTICNAVTESKLRFPNIVIEINENALLDNSATVLNVIRQLSRNGIEISMDDFGTGYSSLSYLRKYPFDYIKLDGSFIQNMDSDASNVKLVEAAIRMAHALDIKVVAEGVETNKQLDILAGLGCDVAQGYYFSNPLTMQQFKEYCTTQKKVVAFRR